MKAHKALLHIHRFKDHYYIGRPNFRNPQAFLRCKCGAMRHDILGKITDTIVQDFVRLKQVPQGSYGEIQKGESRGAVIYPQKSLDDL